MPIIVSAETLYPAASVKIINKDPGDSVPVTLSDRPVSVINAPSGALKVDLVNPVTSVTANISNPILKVEFAAPPIVRIAQSKHEYKVVELRQPNLSTSVSSTEIQSRLNIEAQAGWKFVNITTDNYGPSQRGQASGFPVPGRATA